VVENSPAWEAGLRGGDEIVSLDGIGVETWDHMLAIMTDRLGERVEMEVDRGGLVVPLSLDLRPVSDVYAVGMYDFRPAVVGDVKRGGPADLAGLQAGDRVLRIEDRKIEAWTDLSEAIRSSPAETLMIEWERNGEILSSTVTPIITEGYGMIEIYSRIEKREVGLLEAFRIGFQTTVWVAKQIFNLPRLLLTGTAFRDVVGGPVRIGELAGESIRWGFGTFLGFIAAISAQLSLVNLLPIPVLDGGHLMLIGVETATRKPITHRQRVIAQQIGFAFLFALMVLITLVDVSRFLGG
jgi:regulator of sigma E protease